MRPGAAILGVAALAAGLAARSAVGETREKRTGAVVGHVIVLDEDGRAVDDASEVVVTVEGAPAKPARRAPPRHTIRQKGKHFDPSFSVVEAGTQVAFPNDDKVFHNVFSQSRAARFDLGLYKGGDSKSVTFKRAGVIDVHCNIHPRMVARVRVVDTPYYAVTGPDGEFRIEGVPVGKVVLAAATAFGEPVQIDIEVATGEPAPVTLRVRRGKPPSQHQRKDGTPYGRYR
jgi:plastocyanin